MQLPFNTGTRDSFCSGCILGGITYNLGIDELFQRVGVIFLAATFVGFSNFVEVRKMEQLAAPTHCVRLAGGLGRSGVMMGLGSLVDSLLAFQAVQVPLAFQSRRLVAEQIAAGLYGPVEYSAAVMLANLPLQFMFVVIFMLPVFFLSHVSGGDGAGALPSQSRCTCGIYFAETSLHAVCKPLASGRDVFHLGSLQPHARDKLPCTSSRCRRAIARLGPDRNLRVNRNPIHAQWISTPSSVDAVCVAVHILLFALQLGCSQVRHGHGWTGVSRNYVPPPAPP